VPTILEAISPLMNDALGAAPAKSVFRTLPPAAQQTPGSLDVVEVRDLLSQLETSGQLFARPGKPISTRQLRVAITGGAPARSKEQRFTIQSDGDVLVVQRATQALTKGFFGVTDCVRLATAVSELARNIYMYARQGVVTLSLNEEPNTFFFVVTAVDEGPGIPNLELIMSGQYRSRTGLGRGLAGTRALLDALTVDTAVGKGTRIRGERRVRKP